MFSSAIIESADQSIPKILKLRREVRRKKKKNCFDKLGTYNTEYNKLTCSIKLAIRTHIEKKWVFKSWVPIPPPQVFFGS